MVGIVGTTAALAVGWVGVCTFYIGPAMWKTYVQTNGKLPAAEPKVCENSDERAIQILTGLLATLLGLMSNPPSDPNP